MKKIILILISSILLIGTCYANPNSPKSIKTPQEKIKSLEKMVSEYQPTKENTQIFESFRRALRDPSPEVRETAIRYFEYSNHNQTETKAITTLLRIMFDDLNPNVREMAAMRLSSMITSNGAETCTGSSIVEKYLDKFLDGLKDNSTAQFSVEILGMRFSGDKPLTCCFKSEARNRVVNALKDLMQTPPKHTVYASWSSGYPSEALENIAQCANSP
jgi:hypothetical protein